MDHLLSFTYRNITIPYCLGDRTDQQRMSVRSEATPLGVMRKDRTGPPECVCSLGPLCFLLEDAVQPHGLRAVHGNISRPLCAQRGCASGSLPQLSHPAPEYSRKALLSSYVPGAGDRQSSRENQPGTCTLPEVLGRKTI